MLIAIRYSAKDKTKSKAAKLDFLLTAGIKKQ